MADCRNYHVDSDGKTEGEYPIGHYAGHHGQLLLYHRAQEASCHVHHSVHYPTYKTRDEERNFQKKKVIVQDREK